MFYNNALSIVLFVLYILENASKTFKLIYNI